jgi:hypothetical protein
MLFIVYLIEFLKQKQVIVLLNILSVKFPKQIFSILNVLYLEQLYDVMKTNSHRFVKWPEQLKDRLDQILLMRYDLAHDVLDAFKPIIKLSGNTPFRETYFQLLRTAMYRP